MLDSVPVSHGGLDGDAWRSRSRLLFGKQQCTSPDSRAVDEHKAREAGLRNLRRLSDSQWEKVSMVLPGKLGKLARSGNGKVFLEAVLWVADNRMRWLDLPKEFGNSHAVYIRFTRWANDGIWPRVIDVLQRLPGGDARLSALVSDYVEARTLRQLRSSMAALHPRPMPMRKSR